MQLTKCACAAARSFRISQTYASLAAPPGGLGRAGGPRDRPAERRACYVATTRADAPHRAAISSAASQSPGRLPGPHARPRQSTEGAGAMITPENAWDLALPAPIRGRGGTTGSEPARNPGGQRHIRSPENRSRADSSTEKESGTVRRPCHITKCVSAAARCPAPPQSYASIARPLGGWERRQAAAAPARPLETLVIWRGALGLNRNRSQMPGPPHGNRGAGTS